MVEGVTLEACGLKVGTPSTVAEAAFSTLSCQYTSLPTRRDGLPGIGRLQKEHLLSIASPSFGLLWTLCQEANGCCLFIRIQKRRIETKTGVLPTEGVDTV